MRDLVVYFGPRVDQEVNFFVADRTHLLGRELLVGRVITAINSAVEALGVEPCHRVHIGLHDLNVLYSRTFVKGIKYIVPIRKLQ